MFTITDIETGTDYQAEDRDGITAALAAIHGEALAAEREELADQLIARDAEAADTAAYLGVKIS